MASHQGAMVFATGLALAGCALNFDGDTPQLSLVGTPPSLNAMQKLNTGPVYGSAIVRGVDRAYWLSLQEEPKKLRVLRLTPPTAEVTLEGDKFEPPSWRAFFIWHNGDAPADANAPRTASLEMISAGQDANQAQLYDFPLGIGQVIPGGYDDVIAYIPQHPMATGYDLLRRFDGHRRTIPYVVEPTAPKKFFGGFFSGSGDYFFERGACALGCVTDPTDSDLGGTERKSLIAHATDDEVDIDLGLQPRRLILYEPPDTVLRSETALGDRTIKEVFPLRHRRRFVTCGSGGVDVVPVPPTEVDPALHLDDTPCASDVFSLQREPGPSGSEQIVLYYSIAGELRRAPIDGSAAPARALDQPVARVLAIYDPNLILYSQDPGDRYIYGVGDGWIGSWRFMNRGRAISLSYDQTKLHFLENAAQSGGIGELSVAPIGGAVSRVAPNVYQYDDLGDGRLLVAGNHAFRGTQNRVMVIDEDKGEARWVADQASQYSFIPGSTDLLVDIVTGASSYDLMRVPLPPKD